MDLDGLVVAQELFVPLHQFGRRVDVTQVQERQAPHVAANGGDTSNVGIHSAALIARRARRWQRAPYALLDATMRSSWRTVSCSDQSLNRRQNAVDTVAYGLGELGMLGSACTRRCVTCRHQREPDAGLHRGVRDHTQRTQVCNAVLDLLNHFLVRLQNPVTLVTLAASGPGLVHCEALVFSLPD